MDRVAEGLAVLGSIILGLLLYVGIVWKPKVRIGSLRNKHILITGGSSGIGLQIAKEALLQEAFVTLIARNQVKLNMAAEDLTKQISCDRSRINTKSADVSDYKKISQAIKESHMWRPIDVLICNAGFVRSQYLEDTSIEDLDLIIQTNLTGTLYTLHAALPLMKSRDGRPRPPGSVVLMCSLASLFLLYGHDIYTATKYALRGLAESLRLQLIPYNISVSLICPGFVETPLLDQCEDEIEDGMFTLVKIFNLYRRKWAENAKDVARYTLEAAKEGRFITTALFPGVFLYTLSRGVLPADSFSMAFLELILYVPFRVLSFIIASLTPAVLRYVHKRYYKDDNKKLEKVGGKEFVASEPYVSQAGGEPKSQVTRESLHRQSPSLQRTPHIKFTYTRTSPQMRSDPPIDRWKTPSSIRKIKIDFSKATDSGSERGDK